MNKLILFLFSLSFAPPVSAQNWEQVGDFQHSPRSFFEDTIDNRLYIGGGFRYIGQDTFKSICYWDGSQFYPLKTGVKCLDGSTFCTNVTMITRYKNEIYIGASMDTIDGIYANGIAKWDGADWSPVGDVGLYHTEHSTAWVYDALVKDGALHVVGLFRTAAGDTCNSVAYWDGEHWTGMQFVPQLYDNSVPHIYSIEYYKGEWYVGGNFHSIVDGKENRDIARYDGTTWRQVGGGLKGGISWVDDMVVYKDELYISGSFRRVDGNIGNMIMRWDGEKWKDVGGGLCNGYGHAMMVHEDKLFVVGIFDCVANGLPARNIATWDGERWCTFGNSHFDNKLFTVTAFRGDVYIGGGFFHIDGQPVKYFAKWVGDHATDTCSAPVVSAPERPGGRPFLNLRPNPVSDVLRVALPQSAVAVRVYDLAGRDMSGKTGNRNVGANVGEVLNLADVYGAPEVELEVAALPPGWYLLQVVFRDGSSAAAGFVKM